ncbi:hypothetical protein ACFY12_05500 [Streptomyces sp. NPDC001339]|uniref:hypothetical protein n=1 Tax=Streptomyces sp. NPDC001339 TaxID=3364563 RepID=UPI0036AEEBB7
MADDEEKYWVSPEYENVLKYYVGQMQETAKRRGLVPCNNCHGLRVIVVLNPETKEPFNAPCSQCNAGGS